MSRYVAFLRGMNLGRRRIKNDELCLAFEGMGFLDVSAFLASGNVIFDAAETGTSHIAELIEPALEASLGYKVPTFLRTSDEVKAIAAHQPFDNVKEDFAGKIQVGLCAAKVGEAAREAILKLSNDHDRLELTDRELYWMPEGNLLDSDLDLKAIERILCPLTIRTKRTIERIASKFLSA